MGLSDDIREETEAVVNRLDVATNLLVNWLLAAGAGDPEDLKDAFAATAEFFRPIPTEPHAGTEETIGVLMDAINDLQTENEELQSKNGELSSAIEKVIKMVETLELKSQELQTSRGALRTDNDLLRMHVKEDQFAKEQLRTTINGQGEQILELLNETERLRDELAPLTSTPQSTEPPTPAIPDVSSVENVSTDVAPQNGAGAKRCNTCGQVKPYNAFTINKTIPDRHGRYCRDCVSAKKKAARDAKVTTAAPAPIGHPVSNHVTREAKIITYAGADDAFQRAKAEYHKWLNAGEMASPEFEEECAAALGLPVCKMTDVRIEVLAERAHRHVVRCAECAQPFESHDRNTTCPSCRRVAAEVAA
jgi:DNA-binding transcriptional regulator GbsR (MarR family)